MVLEMLSLLIFGGLIRLWEFENASVMDSENEGDRYRHWNWARERDGYGDVFAYFW